MIVCHCKGISDRAIRKAVRQGARSRGDILGACAAGMAGKTCGGCVPAIDEIVEREANREGATSPLGLAELATG
jgi:bacterioferritin-associated ferredoxin